MPGIAPERETLISDSGPVSKKPGRVAATFRNIYRELGAPVVGRISVTRIQRGFSSIVDYAGDPDARVNVNMAIQTCFGLVQNPPAERGDLLTSLNPLNRLQEQLEETGVKKSATLQLVIDTLKTLSSRPESDSIMRAQVAGLAFAQALGEFGLDLPQSLEPGEALLEELIKSNDQAVLKSRQR